MITASRSNPPGRAAIVRRGFTMVEALISLAITATLMVAMASAFTAAGASVEGNDRYFRAVQQGRVALDLIMGEVRRCQGITSCSPTSLTLTAATTDYNGATLTFAYDSVHSKITMAVGGGSAVDLADNVTSAQFNSLTISGNFSEIAMTLSEAFGSDSVTLSNSAAPRYSLGSEWN